MIDTTSNECLCSLGSVNSERYPCLTPVKVTDDGGLHQYEEPKQKRAIGPEAAAPDQREQIEGKAPCRLSVGERASLGRFTSKQEGESYPAYYNSLDTLTEHECGRTSSAFTRHPTQTFYNTLQGNMLTGIRYR